MPDILLATLNASWPHAAFGLRYLMANLEELQPRAEIAEFTINQRLEVIAEDILTKAPRILGLGIYIWNAKPSLDLVRLLRARRPDLQIVLGGPEVSYETEQQEITALADYVITGEADLAFRDLCRQLLAGESPGRRIIPAPLPQMAALQLPYHLYTPQDLAHRVVYVEASRGCPFTCEFCLSSLDIPVRAVALDRLLPALEDLLQRGLRQFKFVDRTFNLNLHTSRALLEFFLERMQPGLFLHFEMIPDRLPDGLREIIAKFPPGSLQFEVGIQTFSELASQNISRRNNHARTAENFAFLRSSTGVHIHADLIIGLPGENAASFGAGFDRLLAMGPQEIQVGMLKRLRGTPIIRHDAEYAMRYRPEPPYEVISTRDIPAEQMQELRRFSRYWDLLGNSGNFLTSLPLLWRDGASPFAEFLTLSRHLWQQTGATDSLPLLRVAQLLFDWLTERRGIPAPEAARAIRADYVRPGRHAERPPAWLAVHLGDAAAQASAPARPLPKRQARHAGG